MKGSVTLLFLFFNFNRKTKLKQNENCNKNKEKVNKTKRLMIPFVDYLILTLKVSGTYTTIAIGNNKLKCNN